MNSRNNETPEVAMHSYPEVVQSPPPPSVQINYAPSTPAYSMAHPMTPPKMDSQTFSTMSVSSVAGLPAYGTPSPYFNNNQVPTQDATILAAAPAPAAVVAEGGENNDEKRRGSRLARLCGCAPSVLLSACIIALLAAAVIGLAAGTGVSVRRAQRAEALVAAFQATADTTIDNNCSVTPSTVSGTTYTSFDLLGQITYTMYCNKDTIGAPLMSLFVADFNLCMDACSAFSKYAPSDFGKNNTNVTCGGVSFIPQWSTKINATADKAPGNCYLKPGPQNSTTLSAPAGTVAVHAGILLG